MKKQPKPRKPSLTARLAATMAENDTLTRERDAAMRQLADANRKLEDAQTDLTISQRTAEKRLRDKDKLDAALVFVHNELAGERTLQTAAQIRKQQEEQEARKRQYGHYGAAPCMSALDEARASEEKQPDEPTAAQLQRLIGRIEGKIRSVCAFLESQREGTL